MAIESKLHRCAEDDPKRCQAVTGVGQCPYLSSEGTDRCVMHGAVVYQRAQLIKEQRNYNLGKWQARVERFTEGERVKTLREEIGITRMLLEELIIKCQDSDELLINSPKIENLVIKIERLVVSCQKMEEASGSLMDESQVKQLASKVYEIVVRHVKDADVVSAIADEIVAEVGG